SGAPEGQPREFGFMLAGFFEGKVLREPPRHLVRLPGDQNAAVGDRATGRAKTPVRRASRMGLACRLVRISPGHHDLFLTSRMKPVCLASYTRLRRTRNGSPRCVRKKEPCR